LEKRSWRKMRRRKRRKRVLRAEGGPVMMTTTRANVLEIATRGAVSAWL
jgi:hypothetical protein